MFVPSRREYLVNSANLNPQAGCCVERTGEDNSIIKSYCWFNINYLSIDLLIILFFVDGRMSV